MPLNPPPPPNPGCDPPRTPAAAPGRGVRVWLLRHGQVDRAYAGQAYGARDVPLSPRGEQQTQAAGRALADLEVDRIVASPLERARRLGQEIATRTGTDLLLDPRLGEIDRGDWQRLDRDVYQARWDAQEAEYWRDPGHWRGHGGETEIELAERTWAAFEEACSGVTRLVIAAHRNVVRSIVASALGLPFGRSHALYLRPGRGALLVDGPAGWTLSRVGAGPEAGP